MATKQDESAVHRRVEDLLDKLRSGSKNAQNAPGDLSRRNFLRLGALGGAAASLTGLVTAPSARAAESAPDDLNEATIFQLQAAMSSGRLTARELAEFYLERIEELDQDKNGPRVNSILEINPDALAIAGARDAERRARGPRGPLHGYQSCSKTTLIPPIGCRRQPVLLPWSAPPHSRMPRWPLSFVPPALSSSARPT